MSDKQMKTAKAFVFHYDMTNPELVLELHLGTSDEFVRGVWIAGGYELTFGMAMPMMKDRQALDAAFTVTQETAHARSTSVGDVIVIEQRPGDFRAYLVSPVGFRELKGFEEWMRVTRIEL